MKAKNSILAALLLTAVSVPMSVLATINNISSNKYQTLYINKYNKEVFTMGQKTNGLMGVYSTPATTAIPNGLYQLVPITTGVLNARSVVATESKSYVLTEAKHVYVWGYDSVTRKTSNTPLKMPLENVIDVAGTKTQAAFIIDPDGDGVGNLMITDFVKDTYYSNLTDAVQVSGGDDFFVVLKKDGTVYTIGSNTKGQLGVGDVNPRTDAVKVPYLNNVITISAGASHSIVLHDDGSVSTWGNNNCDAYGIYPFTMCTKLGYANAVNTFIPQKVPGLTNVTEISAGFNDTTVLTKDRTVKVTGAHNYSYMNQCAGSNTGRPLAPPAVPCPKSDMNGLFYKGLPFKNLASPSFIELPIVNATDISSTGATKFVGFNDGSMKVWGGDSILSNFGKFGDGTVFSSLYLIDMAPAAVVTNYKVVVNDAPVVPAPVLKEDPITKTPVVVIPPTTPEHVVITPEVNDDNVLTAECKNGNGYGDANHCHIKVDKINKETGHS